jgi:flagellar hook assembly protein FlgD
VAGALPRALAFAAVVPNPVRDRATFAIDVPAAAGRVELALYDLAGRRVRTLVSGALPAGRHTVSWDGRGDAGARLAPGLYLAHLEGAGRSLSRRVTFMP